MWSDIFFCLKTNWRRVGVKRQKKISFGAENVMSMRSSLLLCVKFAQKNSSRWREVVENCSTFQRCRTVEKDLNMAVSCWELQWGCYVTGYQLVEGQKMSKYFCEKYERSLVYFNLKETSLKRRNKSEIHWQAKCPH